MGVDVLTWSQEGGGRCSDLVLRGVDVQTWSWGEGVDVQTWSQGGGRWLTISVAHLPPPLFGDRMTNTCENITFARFATRAVINVN